MQRKLEEALARAEDAAAEAGVLQCSAYVCSVLGLASVLAGALFHGLHEGAWRGHDAAMQKVPMGGKHGVPCSPTNTSAGNVIISCRGCQGAGKLAVLGHGPPTTQQVASRRI